MSQGGSSTLPVVGAGPGGRLVRPVQEHDEQVGEQVVEPALLAHRSVADALQHGPVEMLGKRLEHLAGIVDELQEEELHIAVLCAVGEQALQGLHVARQLGLGEVLLGPGVADPSSLRYRTYRYCTVLGIPDI